MFGVEQRPFEVIGTGPLYLACVCLCVSVCDHRLEGLRENEQGGSEASPFLVTLIGVL